MIQLFKYLCVALGLFILANLGKEIYEDTWDWVSMLKQLGALFICIDLGVFLSQSKHLLNMRLRDYFLQSAQPLSQKAKLANRLGHVGFILILFSWALTFST